MDQRIRLVSLGLVVATFAIVARLFFWQVVKGEDLAIQGRAQQQSNSRILAQRGHILASDESWLAASTDAWLLYASPKEINDNPYQIAEKLAPFTSDLNIIERRYELEKKSMNDSLDPDNESKEMEETLDQLKLSAIDKEIKRLTSLISRNELVWVALKNRVANDTRDRIEELGIEGIGFQQQEARLYPESSLAAHLLGFVGQQEDGSDKGYFGLEGYYDDALAGKHGFVSREANPFGAPIIFGTSRESSAMRGVDLVTNIDKTIQIIVERHLEAGMEKYGAVSGTIIVMRPQDGAILALASQPNFNPSEYFIYGDSLFRNSAISDSFEPGSIFKPIVIAAGIDAGVITPETICDICGSAYKIDKFLIRTWNDQYVPDRTMTDVLVNSDNVGMVFTGNRLGREKMYDYLSKFGFGQVTGVDLQGEVTPKLREKGTWNLVDLATASFGQGLAVTPIQMVRAISAIANDGMLPQPHVVRKLRVGDNLQDVASKPAERVISKNAADQVTLMMVEAVKGGEAKWAVPSGYVVAGKTGTAQIPVAGHYDDEKTIASFVGFAPPHAPEFVMLITLREPQSSPWAAETAAPLWFDIARDLFPYMGVRPGN